MYVHLQTELRGAPKYNINFMILCLVGVWMPLAALDGSSLVNDKSTSLRLESRTVCVNSVCFGRIIYIYGVLLMIWTPFWLLVVIIFNGSGPETNSHYTGGTWWHALTTLPTWLCRPPRNLLMCRWRCRWWSSRLRVITTDPLQQRDTREGQSNVAVENP